VPPRLAALAAVVDERLTIHPGIELLPLAMRRRWPPGLFEQKNSSSLSDVAAEKNGTQKPTSFQLRRISCAG